MRAVSFRFAGVVFAAALLATVVAAQSTEYGGATAPVTPNYGGATPSAEYGGVTPVPEVPKPPSSIVVEDDLVDMEDLLSVSVPEGLSPYDTKMLIVERLSARLEDLNQKVDMYHQERARVEAAMELSFQRLQDQYRAFALREKDRLNARDLPAVVRDLYEIAAMMEEEQEKHFSQAQQWSRIAKASFDRVLKLEKQRDVLQRKIVAAAIEVTTLPRPTLEA